MDLPDPGSRSRAAVHQNAGLLMLRAALRVLFVGHSLNKLLGWFHSAGLAASGRFFASVGYSPGRNYTILAGVTERHADLVPAGPQDVLPAASGVHRAAYDAQ